MIVRKNPMCKSLSFFLSLSHVCVSTFFIIELRMQHGRGVIYTHTHNIYIYTWVYQIRQRKRFGSAFR